MSHSQFKNEAGSFLPKWQVIKMLNMVCVPLTISVTFSYEDSALIGFHKQYVKWLVT